MAAKLAKQKHVKYQIHEGNFPLAPAMMKRIFGGTDEITAFHLCNPSNLRRLVDLDESGNSGSVSCFINMKKANFTKGVYAGAGVIAKIKGIPLVMSDGDIISRPDTSKIRWVPVEKLSIDKPEWKFVANGMRQAKENVQEKLPIPIKHPTTVTNYWDYFIGPLDHGKLKYQIIRGYYGQVERFVVNNRDKIRQLLFDYDPDCTHVENWDELVINNITIEEIFLFEDILQREIIELIKAEPTSSRYKFLIGNIDNVSDWMKETKNEESTTQI